MLVEITERAMAHCGSQEVLIVGGVGCKYITDRCLKETSNLNFLHFVLLGHVGWSIFHHPVPKGISSSYNTSYTIIGT